jgi:hypothetical protein
VGLNLPNRLRLTLLYCLVLGFSFIAFFYIGDLGFRHSIETTVNEASRSNLETGGDTGSGPGAGHFALDCRDSRGHDPSVKRAEIWLGVPPELAGIAGILSN